ncbi:MULTISPECIES: AEC family transporter [Megasphaera]|uniref:Transporter, auxin efflux carrier domain protein n=1 Tax=Megasphaera vaginalis (ex Srinivasan et al. 2021) TaxID=1111454 RepID=U7UKN0_9FIRM|nr:MULTISPECIES: AEC family transporter [Megasphaera]ERT59982.1 transporter, auxin efflux carrier domain protein [Megasphaera vaginalis (ex Srinivasan et al. 2021)]
MVFFYILEYTMLPLFLLVLIGFLVDRKYHIAVKSISKLLFYLIIPCFVFTNIYKTDFPTTSPRIIGCVFLLLLLSLFIADGVSKWRHYDEGMLQSCRNAFMFNNTGNLGVALIVLVFSHEPFVVNGDTPYLSEALVIWIIIFVIQSVGLNTLGLYQAGRGRLSARDALRATLRLPMLYVFAAAVFCRLFNIPADRFSFWPIMQMAGGAITPVAMFAVGVQISQTKIKWLDPDVWIVSLLKFFLVPLVGLGIIFGANWLLPGTFTAVGALVFLIYCAVPTAVNTAMYAMEFDNYPDYATQVVMNTTAMSAFSLTLVIFIGHLIFV